MGLKNDLKLALKPNKFSELSRATDFNSGLKLMLVWGLFFIAVNVIVSFINGLIGGQTLGKLMGFSFFTSLSATILMILSILVISLVGGWLSKLLFKGAGNIPRSIAALSYVMVPIFLIGVVQNLILFIDSVGGLFISQTAFKWIYGFLMIISLLWVAWLSTEGLVWANNIKKFPGLICFLVGLVVISIINLFVIGWLVALLTGLFGAIGVF